VQLADQPRSLRERKKLQTRAAIRRASLELAETNGYANVTVEQIADAAGVSHATFFRYFPSKGAALISDEIDQVFMAAFADQPVAIPTLEAFRLAMDATRDVVSTPEWRFEHRLRTLVWSIPELRELQKAGHRRTGKKMAEVACRRLGRDPDDFQVAMFFGALIDAGLAALGDRPGIPETMDRVFEFIDNGMPLHPCTVPVAQSG
jgi:AcrR family transcriptional regulator